MTTIARIHSHDVAGPVIVLHLAHDGRIGPGDPGHAFGPFASQQDAIDFEENADDDTCHKVMVDLIDPAVRSGLTRG